MTPHETIKLTSRKVVMKRQKIWFPLLLNYENLALAPTSSYTKHYTKFIRTFMVRAGLI